MKSLLASGALSIVVALSLSSCLYPPPPPPPFAPAPFVAPAPGPYVVPAAMPPRPVYRHCARGWHWVAGHHNRYGRWIRGHCVPNRR